MIVDKKFIYFIAFYTFKNMIKRLLHDVFDPSPDLSPWTLVGAMNREHKQIHLIIISFAKAFNKVPNRRLLHKLDYHRIRWPTHNWINSWLSWCIQSIVSDGQVTEIWCATVVDLWSDPLSHCNEWYKLRFVQS